MIYPEIVGVATGIRERNPGTFLKGLCGGLIALSRADHCPAKGQPLQESSGVFLLAPTVLLTSARANVRGREELNRVRLLTSQRSKPSRGTCGNGQIGNDARSSRYERPEDESSRNGAAVLNRMAESREVSLLGLSYD